MRKSWNSLFITLLLAGVLAACTNSAPFPETSTPSLGTTHPLPTSLPAQRIPLSVFCAGSLILPFAELEAAFEAAYPEVDVMNECHGSIQVIRHVTELHEKIDVVATADAILIPMLMYTTSNPDTGRPYTSWYVSFAGNNLALAYGPHTLTAQELTVDNWFEIISRPGVKVGLADPRFDASGYRALMALKLAEKYYNRPGIFNGLVKNTFRYPITAFAEEGRIEITVPEIVEPLPSSKILIRGASIQLIALLESGDLDYAFEYKSVIRQHNLGLVQLPQMIDLGSESQTNHYAQVQVKLDFQRFASVKPVFKGEPIRYGITIPENAPHPQQAADFISFLLGEQGQVIMEKNFQPLSRPPVCDGTGIPSNVAIWCHNEDQ